MKVLIINDWLVDSSTYNRAKALKKYITDYDIEIVAGHRNHETVVPILPNYDILHFNYTGKVDSYFQPLKDLNLLDRTILTIVNERSLLTGFAVDPERLKEMMKAVRHVTSVSKKIAQMFGCHYIPNGVDLEIFSQPKRLVVGFVGKRKEEKGYPELLEVCEKLDIELRYLAFRENMICHSEMPPWYRGLDVFVHPSKTEGCSNVVLEAMAMNVPVIMRRVGIWEDLEGVTLIDDGYDPLYNALKELRDKREINTRNFIKNKHYWPDLCYEYKKVYDVVSGR